MESYDSVTGGLKNKLSDDDSSPECLIPPEPVTDPYSSEDTLGEDNQKKGNNEKGHPMQLRSTDVSGKVFSDKSTVTDPTFTSLKLLGGGDDISKMRKDSSELTTRFVQTSFHVEFRPAAKFVKHNCSTVQDYLEELLEFSFSNCNRKKPDEDTGKNLYDKRNVDDIIDYCRRTLPSIDWLFKHFNVDFNTSTTLSLIDIEKLSCMRERTKELNAISFDKKCEMTSDDLIKLWNERKALNFAGSLDNTLKELQKFKRNSTAFDENHELVKQLLGEIGELIDAKARHNGSTKFTTKVFIDKNAEKTKAEDNQEVEIIVMEITTKPDYMFVNDLRSVAYMPIEVYGPGDKAGRSSPPSVSSSSSGLDFSSSCLASLNLNKTQSDHLLQKMQGQHVMQLIAALHDKVKKDERVYAESDKLSEVGIFVVNEHVFLSKISTTAKYLDLFTRDILKEKGMGEYSEEYLASSNKYITIEYTNWDINLRKAAQRHALILFLAQMMHVTC